MPIQVVQANPQQTIVPQNQFVGPTMPQPQVKVVQPVQNITPIKVTQAKPTQTITGVTQATRQVINPIRPANTPAAIDSIYKTIEAGYNPDSILVEFVKQNQKNSPNMVENLIKASQAGYDSQTLLNEVLKQNGFKTVADKQQALNALAPKQQEPGFFTRLGQDIIRTPAQVGKATIGLIDLLGSKLPGTSAERKSMLEERGTNIIQSPTFGATPSYTTQEGIGKGFELGSYFIGGGGAKNVVEAGFKGLVKEGVKQGAKAGLGAGLSAGFGQGLQDQNASPGSVLLSTALGGFGGALTGGTLGAVSGGVGATSKGIFNKVVPNLNKQADEAITYGIERGIKPSVVGKKTDTLYNKFLDRSKLAIKFITESKDELGIKLPKTLDEFADAISKAKQNIFAKYNYLSEQAGQGQAKVYLDSLAKELRKIASDPVLSDIAPSVSKYATDLAETYSRRGSYTTQETQRAIELFNAKLKAFYKNPNSELANKIYLESMIANNLRKLQDETIQNASGQNYQALKNIYGSLAGLEKDVSHRAVVVARQNVKGLLDFSDIFTSGQIVDGILNGSPIQITKGLVGKGVSTYYKMINNPDKIIADMFKKVGVLADKANKTGTKLSPTTELKTMLALPSPSGNVGRGTQPSINLSPINLGSKSQSTLDRLEVSALEKPQMFKKGNALFRGAGKINNYLNETTPGLYTTSKYTIEYVNKNGKKQVLKNLSRADASGWAQQLKKQGLKYTVKTVGSALSAYAVGKNLGKKNN